jgi:hypothetical protein
VESPSSRQATALAFPDLYLSCPQIDSLALAPDDLEIRSANLSPFQLGWEMDSVRRAWLCRHLDALDLGSQGEGGETKNDLFAFLTTEPNALVGTFHPKAMPVILTTREEIDLWMTAPAPEALKLQRPLPDGALVIVARGEKKDEGGMTL